MAVDTATATEFREKYVDADGFRIRYLEAGTGTPLIHFHGAGGLRLYRSHELLAQKHRVLLFEVPGFGNSAVNERSQSVEDLGQSMAEAVTRLGIDQFESYGEFVRWQARVVDCPAGSRPHSVTCARGASSHISREPRTAPGPVTGGSRQAPVRASGAGELPPPLSPEVLAKQNAFTRRLVTPPRAELEARMADFQPPVLVVWGTDDRMIPSEMGGSTSKSYQRPSSSCCMTLGMKRTRIGRKLSPTW